MKCRSFLLPKAAHFIARVAALVGCFPILGWLGASYWLLDLFNHFQVQYAVFLTIALAVLLAMKSFRLAALVGVFLLVPLIRLAPCFIGGSGGTPEATLRIATFNVLTANNHYDDAVKWIRETDPDVVFLPEVDEVWASALSPLEDSHPHVIEHIVEGNFGFALYSKLPIVSQEIIPCGRMELPLLKLRLQGPKGEFTLFGAHPVPPTTEFWSDERNAFLQTLANEAAKETLPIIAVGDFNATRWSQGMKPLWNAGLLDSATGHGAGSTWMRGSYLLAVPIDHVLFRGPGIACTKRWIGPDLGSDHRAVVAEIGW